MREETVRVEETFILFLPTCSLSQQIRCSRSPVWVLGSRRGRDPKEADHCHRDTRSDALSLVLRPRSDTAGVGPSQGFWDACVQI